MAELIEGIRKAVAERTTAWALAVLLGAATTLVLGGLGALEWAGTSLGLISAPLGGQNRAIIVLTLLLFTWLGIGIRWLLWRSIPTVPGAWAGVLFAASAEEEVQTLVRRLHTALDDQIADHGARGLVRTFFLPRNQAVGTLEDATRALDASGGRLIVWGAIRSGTIDGKVVSGFKNVNFTMRHRPLDSSELAGVRAALTPALVGRQWLFSEDQTFLGVDVVAANLTEVAVFALALVLAIDGNLQGAARLLVPLRQWTQGRSQQLRRTQSFLRFSDALRDLLLHVRYRQLLDLYNRELVDRITDRGADAVAHECQILADECAGLSRIPASLDLAKSTLAFHFGRMDDALMLVDSAQRCDPADAAPLLSKAFLALWAGDYSRVGGLYRKAERRGPLGVEMLFQVVRFLQAVHARHPQRQELLFALAVANQHLDRDLARQDFDSFLAATAARDDVEALRAEARRRLASLGISARPSGFAGS